jgi:hypothetical protein
MPACDARAAHAAPALVRPRGLDQGASKDDAIAGVPSAIGSEIVGESPSDAVDAAEAWIAEQPTRPASAWV